MNKIFFVSLLVLSASLSTLAQTNEAIAEYVEPFVKNGDFAGAIFISKADRIIFGGSFGIANHEWNVPHTPESRFLIASISKPITAIAVMTLVQEKKLALDTPVANFIDGFPEGDKITIEHLLSHTSGLRSALPDISRNRRLNLTTAQLVEEIKRTNLRSAVGEQFYYSNSGYAVLAFIVEKVSGMPFRDYIRKRIFAPLGMNDSFEFDEETVIERLAEGYYYNDWEGIKNAPYHSFTSLRGSGSIVSTASDLLSFERGIRNHKILSPDITRTMLTLRSKEYGLGWYIKESMGTQIIEHNGYLDGYRSYLTRYIDNDFTVVILSNIGANNAVDVMKEGIGAILLGKEYEKQPLRTYIKLDEKQRKRVVGVYGFEFSERFRLTVRENPGGFLEISVGGPFSVIFPESETRYFHRNSQSEYIFKEDETGRVIGVEMSFFGRRYDGKRVEK